MPAHSHGGPGVARAWIVLVLLAGSPVLGGVSGCTSRTTPATNQAANVQEANMKVVQIPVEGMSCAACVARVKKTLAAIGGVSDVEVSLVERRARVRFDPSRLSADQLVAAIKGLGYQAGAPSAVQ